MACNYLQILTINAQGLREKQKRNRFYQWVKQQKATIVLAQETHFTDDMMPYITTEWPGDILHSIGTSNSRGVSIFIHEKLNAESIDKTVDKDGRYIIMNLKINEEIYCLVNIYAPNDLHKRNFFWKHIKTDIESKSQGLKILAGDWNEIHYMTDRKSRNTRIKLNPYMKHLKKEHNLFDPWVYKNKNKQQYTWRRKNSNIEAGRIDYFLIQEGLRQKIEKSDIRPAQIKYTDHQALSLVINIKVTERGPGYWKFNKSLMKDAK